MIRISKKPFGELAPEFRKLFTTRKNDTSVSRLSQGNALYDQIYADQHGKCYLCERHLCTDIQVDHLRPKAKNSAPTLDWNNLYITCSYCNFVKNSKYPDLLNPALTEPCRLVRHKISFENEFFIFAPSDPTDIPQIQTARLLSDIFNDISGKNTIKKRNLHAYVIRALSEFRDLCIRYLRDPSPLNFSLISRSLSPDAEFLAFKYWMLTADLDLATPFQSALSLIR